MYYNENEMNYHAYCEKVIVKVQKNFNYKFLDMF